MNDDDFASFEEVCWRLLPELSLLPALVRSPASLRSFMNRALECVVEPAVGSEQLKDERGIKVDGGCFRKIGADGGRGGKEQDFFENLFVADESREDDCCCSCCFC